MLSADVAIVSWRDGENVASLLTSSPLTSLGLWVARISSAVTVPSQRFIVIIIFLKVFFPVY